MIAAEGLGIVERGPAEISTAVAAVLCHLAEEAHDVAQAARTAARRDLEMALGRLCMLILELAKLGAVDLAAVKQHARDHAEKLAANPHLTAPHVVRIAVEQCEHQHLRADADVCPSCGMAFVYCPACSGDCEIHHAAPACDDRRVNS
jgi:uncharacterized protein YbbK (DUF523 family)